MRAEWVPARGEAEALREIGDLVRASRAGTGYASPAWMAEMERHMGGAGGFFTVRRERLLAVLPVITRPLHARAAWPTLGLRRRESVGYDGFGGPLFAPDLTGPERREAFAPLAAAARSGVALVNLTPPAFGAEDTADLLEAQGFRRTAPFALAIKDLRGLTERELLQSYHQNHRRSVEAFRKRGARVREAEGAKDYLRFADLLSETMRRASGSVKIPLSLIVDGGRRLVRDGVARLWLATVDDTLAAGVFAILFGRTACYWLGASIGDEQLMRSRPMHGVFHHAFLEAIAAGCEAFELGGMPTNGLRDFKMRWGADVLTQHTFQWSPWNALQRARALSAWVATARRPAASVPG
jgi:hypothetical protein